MDSPANPRADGVASRRCEWRPPGDVPEPGQPPEMPPEEPEEQPPAPPPEEPPGPDEVPPPAPPESDERLAAHARGGQPR